MHLRDGRHAGCWLQRLLLQPDLHLPDSLHRLHPARHLAAALKSLRPRFSYAWTPLHSHHRHHREYLLDFQAECLDAGQIYAVDVFRYALGDLIFISTLKPFSPAGLIMYFYYGITNSLLENQSEEIELTVDTHYITPEKVDPNRLGI